MLAGKILQTYPDRFPVIVERATHAAKHTPNIAKEKFLVPIDFKAAEFLRELRNQIPKLKSHEALFMFVGKNNALLPTNLHMADIYARFKDEDGFLYVSYSLENVFG